MSASSSATRAGVAAAARRATTGEPSDAHPATGGNPAPPNGVDADMPAVMTMTEAGTAPVAPFPGVTSSAEWDVRDLTRVVSAGSVDVPTAPRARSEGSPVADAARAVPDQTPGDTSSDQGRPEAVDVATETPEERAARF